MPRCSFSLLGRPLAFTPPLLVVGTLLVGTPLASMLLASAAWAADAEVDLARYYGFRDVEVFKLEERSENLRAADLDGDGRVDLVLVDNSHSRIDWLRQRATKPADLATTDAKVNSVEDAWRFEHVKIPVDREVSGLVVGDFNSDGRADLAYVGLPDRLIVKYAPAKDAANPSAWSETAEQRLPDPADGGTILAAGDINGDGRVDLVMLGKQNTYIVRQTAAGKLDPADKLMNTSEGLALAQIADLDGDGRGDLSYSAADGSDRILCARLQTPQGTLGPELRFPLAKPRSVTLANVDAKPGVELLTIDSTTDRISVLQLVRAEQTTDELAQRLVQYGFGDQSTRNERDLAIGDIDGDGRADVVVTDPAAAQMIVFRQQTKAGLDLGTTYPGLMGAEQVRIADLDGDGTAEVYVLSEKEGTVGVSRFEDGRLTFPRPLGLGADPLAFEIADANGDGTPELVLVSKSSESGKYAIKAFHTAQGQDTARGQEAGKTWQPVALAAGGKPEDALELTLRGTPKRLVAFDGNHDGRSDFIAFLGLGRAPQVLISEAKAGLTAPELSGGIGLGDISQGAFTAGTVRDPSTERDRPALLVSQGAFARNLELRDGSWRVVDQYNAPETGARIEGTAALDLDGQAGNEIVLIDSGVKKLRILRADGSLYQPWKEVETGPFPYISTHVADLNADGRNDLLLFGRGRFAVLYAGHSDSKLKETASFESDLKDVYFVDIAAGDLNHDGYADLALLDTLKHVVEILDYDPVAGPRHATSFPVFEEKSFAGDGGGGINPREAAVADVTGDGRNDLILLVHDRVLVYPQDDGTSSPAPTAKPAQAEEVSPAEAGEVPAEAGDAGE